MTDTVTVSRELLRQVLEAVNSYPHRHLTPSIAATRVALRAALEQPAPVQEPIGYLAFRDGKPSWDEDCVCEDAVYPVDADDDRVSVAIYTAPQPDRIAQLEAANTNLFEQGQKMHKRIQELERDCKIGAQEMVKAYEEIDNLKAQMFMHEPVTDEENERFSRDVSNFKGSDPEATKYALEAFLRNRVQTAPVQESSDSDYATIAGLDASIGHLSRLVDEQRKLLVRCADVFGVDRFGIPFEDGDSELIDRVREMVATTTSPTAIQWPKARDVGRYGDMSQEAHMRVGLDSDNDVFVSVWDGAGGAT